jgi:hypothetical protein
VYNEGHNLRLALYNEQQFAYPKSALELFKLSKPEDEG